MKKTLAILLAVIMLLASFAISFAVFADEPVDPICSACGKQHTSTVRGSCTCCLRCPYLDLSKVVACHKDNNGVTSSYCCGNCTGFYGCTCGQNPDCGCRFCNGTGVEQETDVKPIVPEQTQIHIKELFQTIMHKISEVFDRIFEAAFAVLNVK